MVPTSSTVTSMTSPGSIQTGGGRAKPTPPGVPGAITSPGGRRGGGEEKASPPGDARCEERVWVPPPPAALRAEPGGTAHCADPHVGRDALGADRHAAGEVLPGGPLGGGPLPVPTGSVVEDHEARDRVERLLRTDVAAAGADHDAKLALVIELAGQGGLY